MNFSTWTLECRAEAAKLVLAQGLTLEEAVERISIPCAKNRPTEFGKSQLEMDDDIALSHEFFESLSNKKCAVLVSVTGRQSVQLRENNVGEWSEYFEDFPEENQANYVAGRFDPSRAITQRENQENAALKLREDQRQLDTEIAAIVEKHKPTERARKI